MSIPVSSLCSPHRSPCFPEYEDRLFLCLEEIVLKDLPVLLSSSALHSCISQHPIYHF